MRHLLKTLLLAWLATIPGLASPPGPASDLSRSEALRMIAGIRHTLARQGRTLIAGAIAPTHSMEPLLNNDCFILIEPVPFARIKVNDLIAFRDPRFRVHEGKICHRVVEKKKDYLLTRGDALPYDDDWIVRPRDVIGRVFAIIYFNDHPSAARRKGRVPSVPGPDVKIRHALHVAPAGGGPIAIIRSRASPSS